jgi:hypothetical protein
MLQKTFIIVLLNQTRVTLLVQSRAESNEQSSVHNLQNAGIFRISTHCVLFLPENNVVHRIHYQV